MTCNGHPEKIVGDLAGSLRAHDENMMKTSLGKRDSILLLR